MTRPAIELAVGIALGLTLAVLLIAPGRARGQDADAALSVRAVVLPQPLKIPGGPWITGELAGCRINVAPTEIRGADVLIDVTC